MSHLPLSHPMFPMAADLAAHPLTRDCLLGCAAVFVIAALLDALARHQFGGIYALLPALVPLDRIGAQLMGAAIWLLGLSLLIGATDWAQRDLSVVAAPKLIAALITWLACFWIIVQRRRQRLQGASFARASLIVAIPAVVALTLSLPSAR